MRKHIIAVVIGSMSSFSAAASCQYPLDATNADYQGWEQFPYVNLQSFGYTSESTFNPATGYLGIRNMVAVSHDAVQAVIASSADGLPSGDIQLPSTGIVAVEFAVDNFQQFLTNSANNNISMGFTTSNNIGDITDVNLVVGDGMTFGLGFNSMTNGAYVMPIAYRRENQEPAFANAPSVPLALPLPASFRAGIYFNMDTQQVGYTVNGADYGYVPGFTIPADVQSGLMIASGVSQVGLTDATIGMPVGGTLITDRAQFTQPFPAGVVDICGGSSGPVLPNGKPFPGKGNAYGLQKNAQQRGAGALQALPLGLGLKKK